MNEEIILHRGTTLVRRLRLEPGEAMPWHHDPYPRVTVLIKGESLTIEYQDGSPSIELPLTPGQVDWDEPMDRIHRVRNSGGDTYEEVTVFFMDDPDAVHQPEHTVPSDSEA
jgi:quercetin dioxygenase-like cupin family protein